MTDPCLVHETEYLSSKTQDESQGKEESRLVMLTFPIERMRNLTVSPPYTFVFYKSEGWKVFRMWNHLIHRSYMDHERRK